MEYLGAVIMVVGLLSACVITVLGVFHLFDV